VKEPKIVKSAGPGDIRVELLKKRPSESVQNDSTTIHNIHK
jgi:hypothetical protein